MGDERVNINGSNKNCDNCQGAVFLGVNSIGLRVYGCRNRKDTCSPGGTIIEQMESDGVYLKKVRRR